MFKKILIPLDGTARSEQAMEIAKKIGKVTEADLTLLGVVKPRPVLVNTYVNRTPPYTNLYQASDHVASQLHLVAARARRIVPYITTTVKFGDPADVIVETAEEREIDLIVMTTHGYGGLDRMLFGSVAEHVMRKAPCPVLIAKDSHVPRHILIALDGTPFAETIIEPALALADAVDAKVTLTRIENPAELISARDVPDLVRFDREIAEAYICATNDEPQTYLKTVFDRYGFDDDDMLDYEVGTGRPGEGLLAIADRHDCDMIAMATHGRRGYARLLHGSVTENVLHHTGEKGMLIVHGRE